MIEYNLDNYGVDYFLVNSTNKFLLEYVPDDENACNQLTGFTGDVGDALLSKNEKILLFVDSRFHIQADLEVDKTKVEVVKLQLGQKFDDEICLRIKPNSILGVNPNTISQRRYEYLKALLNEINVQVKFVDINTQTRHGEFVSVPVELTGKTTEEKLKETGNNILITKSEEISYLMNLRCFTFNYSTKIDGKLLITDNNYTLYTDYNGDTSDKIKPLAEFEQDVVKIKSPIRVDKASVTAKDYSLIQNPIQAVSPVKLTKSVKNSAEIEHMKYCFAMTDKSLRATRDWIYETENLTEYEITQKLEENFKKFGAKSLSFKSIVARNENSALAHYNKSDNTKPLKDGDLILIDCGAYYDGGLATDITRVFVKGKPTNLQKQVYTTVLKVFLNCFNYQTTKETCGFEIDRLAHIIFDQNRIKGFEFSHGLGHGVGIGVHEAPPNLSRNEIAKTNIQENMCFTIEPGLYRENYFGVRLENTCYLKNGVIKSFSNMCYEEKLIDLELLNDSEKEILSNFEVI